MRSELEKIEIEIRDKMNKQLRVNRQCTYLVISGVVHTALKMIYDRDLVDFISNTDKPVREFLGMKVIVLDRPEHFIEIG